MAERTCLACRKVLQKDQLIRFVAAPGGVLTVDYAGKLPGRGTYTCFSPECIERALARRQFGRALRSELASVESEDIAHQLRQGIEKKITALLGMGRKSGVIQSGTTEVQALLKGRKTPALIVISYDLAPSLKEKIVALAARRQVPLYRLFSKEDLGRILGKGLRSALAVEAGGLADRLIAELDRYQTVLGEK